MPTLDTIVQKIANAIERQEDYAPGTRAYRNSNPGNIWDGICPGKPKRIWPQFAIDADGFVMFPSYSTGRNVMEQQIRLKISRGETLRVLINQWDSSDPQATRDVYVSHVAEWTQLPSDEPLQSLISV